MLSPVADAAATHWVNRFSLGTQRLPDPLPLCWLLWGNSTVFQVPCMAKPVCSLTTSAAGRDVLNIVFHISCADKCLPCLLPGLMWSYRWTQHKSLRRGWVSPSKTHSCSCFGGNISIVSVNRLGWWLFNYLPPHICYFPFPWKNHIKVLKLFSWRRKLQLSVPTYTYFICSSLATLLILPYTPRCFQPVAHTIENSSYWKQ